MNGKCKVCQKETSMRIQTEGFNDYVCPKCLDTFMKDLVKIVKEEIE